MFFFKAAIRSSMSLVYVWTVCLLVLWSVGVCEKVVFDTVQDYQWTFKIYSTLLIHLSYPCCSFCFFLKRVKEYFVHVFFTHFLLNLYIFKIFLYNILTLFGYFQTLSAKKFVHILDFIVSFLYYLYNLFVLFTVGPEDCLCLKGKPLSDNTS